MSDIEDVPYVVIGAGIAGLTVATELAAKGRDVVVLEARDRIGGRIFTENAECGEPIEMGGQWLNPGHDRMFELVERAGLQLVDVSTGDSSVLLDDRVIRIPVAESAGGHPLTPFEVADLGQGLLRLRHLTERVADDEPWTLANAAWLGQPLDGWAHANLRTPGGQAEFARIMRRAVGGTQGVSLLDALRKVFGRDLNSLASVTGGVQQRRVDGGIGQVCDYLAAQLGDRILLSHPVTKVTREDQWVVVQAGERTVRAHDVIVTIPPGLVSAIDFEPALPEWRRELVEDVPRGNVIKAALVYDTPWWREQGLSGQAAADAGPLRVISDTSNPGSTRGVLSGFFEGPEASGLGRWSITLRQRAFTEAVQRVFGEDAPRPLEYLDIDWASETYSGGCHGAHFAPSVWSSVAPTISASEGRIHFAGTEYSSRFTGYMEGAVRSAQGVAEHLLKH